MRFPWPKPIPFPRRLAEISHQLEIDLISAKFAEIDAHAYNQALTLKIIHVRTLTGNLDHGKVPFPALTESPSDVFRPPLGIDKAGQKSPRG